ncbi:MAG: helix-turn-helix transcriptional regulator [Fibrobacteres bacterium]|nr:helix-turn-helix transcriptional regulator [Fibrobacterota bacterium]
MAAVGKIRSNLLRKEISLVNKKPLKGFVRTFTSIIVILTSIASMIFVFWRKRSPQIQPVKTDEKKEKDPLFSAIDNFIDNHISEDISTDRILKDLRLSSYSFYRVLKNNGIQSLPKLLNIKRVEKAKKLLLETEKSISEIGYETGFGEARYFNKVFKDHTSLTPGEFRKKR